MEPYCEKNNSLIKMETQNADFFCDVTKHVKIFYETPVILITKKDYSDETFNILCSIRKPIEDNDRTKIIEIIVDFHLQWLHAVNEIDNFQKRINILQREEIYEAISYTIDAMSSRLKYYQNYMEKYRSALPNTAQLNIVADLEIVDEMHTEVIHYLLDKLKCFRNFASDDVFNLNVKKAVEELLQWLDKIYDNLALIISKYVNIDVPHLRTDLTKTLQQIVDDLQHAQTPSAIMLLEELKAKGKELSSMVRSTTGHRLELSKIVEKIETLDDRIKRLENEPSSAALMALKNKKEILEKRLSSLENLKTTLKSLHEETDVPLEDEEVCSCEDFYHFMIFNHLLPPEERERLVTDLCYVWDTAVYGERSHKSIISILSAADMKEEFEDEHGKFFVDEHSRKIYKKLETDDVLYQLNEKNDLVPLSDDGENIYFYDECGRYYIDAKTRQRVYKAHATASEYMMDASGVLLKLKEERDGVVYYYDNYGRYYIDKNGKHIYRDADAISDYEADELGNLVRIRSHLDIFETCPDDANVTEDFKYLKQTVGSALTKCIAEVIVRQPADPIKYLSASLIKFREHIEMRDRWAREKEELDVEREIILAEERAAAERAALEAALLAQGGSETSYDSNLLKYTTAHEDDMVSASQSNFL